MLNIGIVERGSRCLSIMKDLWASHPSHLRLKLVAIATIEKSAECNKYARETGIEIVEDPKDLLSIEHLDWILELTGDPAIMAELIANKPPTMGVLDRATAMRFFDIANLYHQITDWAKETHLATSFASALLEASPDGVYVVDKEFRIINCNNSPLINGGVGKEALEGHFCYEVMHHINEPCALPERICPVQETLRTGLPSRAVQEVSVAEGQTLVCQVTAYPIFDHLHQSSQFVVTVRDMTKDLSERIEERARTLKDKLTRFVQEDRLLSLGQLVASVCHEINNPMTSIVTFNKLVLSSIQEKKTSPEQLQELERYLSLSIRESLRCGEIVKNLLTFARQKSVEARQIDMAKMVDTTILLVKHKLEMAGITYRIDLPRGRYMAWGDSDQIQQCLLNLVFNAIDAMPRGGKMTVTGGINEDDNLVWIAISDTGHGIDHEKLPHIFEPFYSTKPDGKGVGLGLSLVYGIIREHDGTIEVDSEMGKGSTFRIRLPRDLAK